MQYGVHVHLVTKMNYWIGLFFLNLSRNHIPEDIPSYA